MARELSIPEPAAISESDKKMSFLFVGDETFPLMENLIRPYSGSKTDEDITNQIFNCILSRARQQIECTFGILAARFRNLSPTNGSTTVYC